MLGVKANRSSQQATAMVEKRPGKNTCCSFHHGVCRARDGKDRCQQTYSCDWAEGAGAEEGGEEREREKNSKQKHSLPPLSLPPSLETKSAMTLGYKISGHEAHPLSPAGQPLSRPWLQEERGGQWRGSSDAKKPRQPWSQSSRYLTKSRG